METELNNTKTTSNTTNDVDKVGEIYKVLDKLYGLGEDIQD